MENYLSNNFSVPAKNASEEVLERWRQSCGITRNPKRRFRFTANLSKREELAQMRRTNQEKLRVAVLVSKAALQFIQGFRKGFVRDKYRPPEEVSQAGFEIDADMLSPMVSSRDHDYLKAFSGVEGIARCLDVSLDMGISTIKGPPLPVRQKIFGSNVYDDKPHKSFWAFTWDALHDITLIVLLVCAVISIVLGISIEGWPEGIYDGLGVILCILLVVSIMAISDYKQYLQFRALDEQKKKTFILVTRDGSRQNCSIYDLVVGDVVHLMTGDIVPADGIFIKGYNLLVDESSLTGECEPVNVNETVPFLFSGTKVQDGSGKMLVASVGMKTHLGSLMETVNQIGENETPLQVKLNGIATIMGKIALAFSLLTFIVLTARFLAEKALHNELLEWSTTDALKLLNSVAIAVTVLVVGIPEGMPLAVTLILAFAARKLMNEKALLKQLSSCETMASVSSICTDKTGTLTTNRMVVDRMLICDEVLLNKDAPDFLKSAKYESVLDILLHSIFLNSGSEVVQGKDGTNTVLGTPTGSALLEFALRLGGHYDDICQRYEILEVWPFNSSTKRRSVHVALPEGGSRVFCTGAAEIILRDCTKIICSNGDCVHLSMEQNRKVLDIINVFCCGALRTLCLAFKDLDNSNDCRVLDGDYTLMAVIGISDPVRPEVKSAVQTCLAAGITVRMVTGDNINTAKAIAKECGILTDDGLAIEAPDLRAILLEQFQELMPKIQVVARSSPVDKFTLVTKLKSEFGEVIAVTGDGTNDASALRAADVGLAMGIAGTEVAKESADVVLMDDNFTTIVNLIRYPGTQVFIILLLLPHDILGVLALVTKLPCDKVEERASAGRNMEIFTSAIWRNIIGQSFYQLTILFLLKFCGLRVLKLSDEDAGRVLHTVIFNSFVLCQVFNEINSREIEKINVFRGLLDSWVFATGIACIVVCQVVVVEFLGPFAHTKPLGWRLWFVSVLIGFLSMPVSVLLKCITASKLVGAINRWKCCVPLSCVQELCRKQD
ncbi:calcium-transporting ATPase 4, plasma membrane-type-like isoform X2 [Actinidia eriantha]|uniref:calcium-transporting ATPase 4, plasma membrane-type-like isoform X2 n=1 Tax=Actinidia eriantha TaxID=165200 RepID=UPI00258E4DC0|nr:calcium-transporting ATPase 4, plasma membrane-type-like isoform X2 [Actinidia eriantha]